ncbi:MAG: hypothetical protein CVV23_15710 [Ignavibacteriae bacterium HGW-Ignavibacteriae-2]|jgi:hypothetical protein|nr:MAG: hypothetical protein CVV23_15710 [Ignavibacteriae bacterium HGW-Ignavibacteriae-2]
MPTLMIKNKSRKKIFFILLNAYLLILSVGSFHHHSINFNSESKNTFSAQSEEYQPQISYCSVIHNSVNTFNFDFTDHSSFHPINSVEIVDNQFELFPAIRTIVSFNLRAPPLA